MRMLGLSGGLGGPDETRSIRVRHRAGCGRVVAAHVKRSKNRYRGSRWGTGVARARVPVPISRNVLSEAPPAEPVAIAVPRPVDEEGLALDLLPLHESPVPAVLRVVAVVAHHEAGVGRDARHLTAVGVPAVRLTAVGERRRSGLDVGLDQAMAVDVDIVAADLDLIARRGHDALDEVPLLVLGILEHDDVAAVGAPQAGQPPFRARELGTIEELVTEDVTARDPRAH